MLIDNQSTIEISVFYRKLGRGYVAYSKKSYEEAKLSEETRSKYKTLKVIMKPLTWQLYNDLQDTAYILDETTNKRKFNYRMYKESKLKTLLTSWDAHSLNEKGEKVPIPITEENIMNLSPDIAEAILDGYDSESLISEDEEKN